MPDSSSASRGHAGMHVMLLAAGRGERMRPLSDALPKPLLEVAGRPLIGHLLDALARDGFEEVVVNTAWQAGRLHAALGDGSQFGLRIRYSDEPPGALETGGGLVHALPLLGQGPFAVVSGDVWTDYPFARLREVPVLDAHLVLVDNPPYKPFGDFGIESAHGRPCAHRTGNRSDWLTYASLGVIHPRLLAGSRPGRFPLAPLLFDAAARGTVTAEHYTGRWHNVGTPADLAALDAELSAPSAGAHCSSGAAFEVPRRGGSKAFRS